MASRNWDGSKNVFEDAAAWIGGVAPLTGDTLNVASGTIVMRGTAEPQPDSYDGFQFSVGANSPAATSALELEDATLGSFTDISSTGTNAYARLVAVGVSTLRGTIEAGANNGTFTIDASVGSARGPADMVVAQGAVITVTGRETLVQSGRLDNHGDILVSGGANLVVNGTLNVVGGVVAISDAYSTLSGSGTTSLGMLGTLMLGGNFNPTTANVAFNGPGGLLEFPDLERFTGHITNFQTGDIIEFFYNNFNNVSADYAFGANGTLTFRNGGSNGVIIGTMNVDGPGAQGVVPIAAEGGAFAALYIGTSVLPTSGNGVQVKVGIAADDHAEKSDVVRATRHTLGGKPIDGTGIRIGIISDSFNGDGFADRDAVNGYLPLKADGVHCGVTVLNDSFASTGTDEGRAMAELIHQAAPGAQLYFYTGEGTDLFASGVTALANAGCNVIVDDLALPDEPFFQPAGAVSTAIEAAVRRGVNYFSAAGNNGAQSFDGTFNTSNAVTTLYDGRSVDAFTFDNGTPYQTLQVLGRPSYYTTLTLQWDSPYPTSAGGSVPEKLRIDVVNSGHALVASSTQQSTTIGGSNVLIPEDAVTFHPAANATYQIDIYDPSGGVLPGRFKYTLSSGYQLDYGNVIVDPVAEQGSGVIVGHSLLPDINTVGATDFPDNANYGAPNAGVEYFSDAGPGSYLFDASGNLLATPQTLNKPDFIAPDGAATSVIGFDRFYGTSAAAPNAAAVAALMLQANPTLTTAQVTSTLKQSAVDLGEPTRLQGAGLIQADTAVDLALAAACFAAGTRIATPQGAVPIERLEPGDEVTLASGGVSRITWMGAMVIDCDGHPRPETVWPIRVMRDAFEPGRPSRDLYLSPDHAVFVDGALVPIHLLVNDATITPCQRRQVTYWHLELQRHDVILAEQLPSESYRDTGNRSAFTAVRACAAAFDRRQNTAACAPFVDGVNELAVVRARLAVQAARLGIGIPSSIEVAVDQAGAVQATIPAGTGTVRLVSPVTRVAGDQRRLGVALQRIAIDGVRVPLNDVRLARGFHGVERKPGQAAHRWTNGEAILRVAPEPWTRRLDLHIVGGAPANSAAG